jgi:hypothetical protein
MDFTGKKVIVFVAASLIVGTLLGARFRPANHIRLEIENGTGRVVLAPQIDDVLEWYTQPNSAHPTPTTAAVQFQQWSPCAEGRAVTSTCKVNAYGLFEYNCVNPFCRDPGVDPRSVTHVKAHPRGGEPGAPPPPSPDPVPVPIGCDQETQNPTPNQNPVSVVQGQVISWSAGNISKFKIKIPAGFCQESASGYITADPLNAVCSVQASAGTTVTYNVEGICAKNVGNFTVSVHQ